MIFHKYKHFFSQKFVRKKFYANQDILKMDGKKLKLVGKYQNLILLYIALVYTKLYQILHMFVTKS